MPFKFSFSIGVSVLIFSASCTNEVNSDDCPEISDPYLIELTEKLQKQTENVRFDLSYVYSLFDVVQAEMIAGIRQKEDSVYVNRIFLLREESFKIMDNVSNYLNPDQYNIQKLDEATTNYKNSIHNILDGAGSEKILADVINDIDCRFIEIEAVDFDKYSGDQVLAEKELYLQKLIEIELLCVTHLLWML